MEKQWEADERNPDFPILRRAWRRNIHDLWNQICSKLQSKAAFASLFPQDGSQEFEAPSSSTGDPATVVNVNFPINGNMEGTFMYDKQPSHLGNVEDSSLAMNAFIPGESNIPHPKDDLGYVSMMDGETTVKQKARSKMEVIPFPDDLRHYKYLPVFVFIILNCRSFACV